jgi:secretion/DNA translocation related TadE-like protein
MAILVLAFGAGVVLVVGAMIVTQVRVSQAADLAALAGARAAWSGTAVACAEAARIAEVQGARLEACERRGLDVQVTAVIVPTLPSLFARVSDDPDGSGVVLRAVARAGPPDSAGLINP